MHHKDSELQIYLIRHGESVMNQSPHLIGGRSDETPLSPLGEEQARKLGRKLKNNRIGFDHVFTSPLARSRQTSELVTGEAGISLAIVEVPELMEFHQGDWEGKVRSNIYTPETLQYINTKGSFFTPPGGESQIMVEHRISGWFLENILNNPEFSNVKSVIGIFSHGVAIECFLHWVMGFNDRLIYRIRLDNTSVSVVRFNRDGWYVDRINDTSHLEI